MDLRFFMNDNVTAAIGEPEFGESVNFELEPVEPEVKEAPAQDIDGAAIAAGMSMIASNSISVIEKALRSRFAGIGKGVMSKLNSVHGLMGTVLVDCSSGVRRASNFKNFPLYAVNCKCEHKVRASTNVKCGTADSFLQDDVVAAVNERPRCKKTGGIVLRDASEFTAEDRDKVVACALSLGMLNATEADNVRAYAGSPLVAVKRMFGGILNRRAKFIEAPAALGIQPKSSGMAFDVDEEISDLDMDAQPASMALDVEGEQSELDMEIKPTGADVIVEDVAVSNPPPEMIDVNPKGIYDL